MCVCVCVERNKQNKIRKLEIEGKARIKKKAHIQKKAGISCEQEECTPEAEAGESLINKRLAGFI